MLNYIEQINAFWEQAERGSSLPVSARLLYFALLHLSNRRGWQNPLFVGNPIICHLTGMTEKTVIQARRALVAAGLIQYTPGDGRGNATGYTINPVNIPGFTAEKAGNFTAFEGEKGGENTAFEEKRLEKRGAFIPAQTKQINKSCNSQSDRQDKRQEFLQGLEDPRAERENPAKEKGSAPEASPAEKRGNGAILSDNAQGGGIPQPEGESAPVAKFAENNYQGTGPTLAQVEAEQRAKGYQLEAARFYSHFAPDWKTANGEPVRSWRKLYAWCETNGLFDTAPQKTQGPQRLPDRDDYGPDRLGPCWETPEEREARKQRERREREERWKDVEDRL